jgi:hypothetical protein
MQELYVGLQRSLIHSVYEVAPMILRLPRCGGLCLVLR